MNFLVHLLLYSYLFDGLIVAATMWHLLHDPKTLEAASKDPALTDRSYRYGVAFLCMATTVAWPITTAWWLVKGRKR